MLGSFIYIFEYYVEGMPYVKKIKPKNPHVPLARELGWPVDPAGRQGADRRGRALEQRCHRGQPGLARLGGREADRLLGRRHREVDLAWPAAQSLPPCDIRTYSISSPCTPSVYI